MQDSYLKPRNSNHNNEEYSPDIQINEVVPQIQRTYSENQNNYMRISSQNQRIDEEAIIQQFNRQFDHQREQELNIPKSNKKKKSQKIPQKPFKKHDLLYIKNKWRVQMEKSIEKFKLILNEQKQSYDVKQKEYLLDFFKLLLDGYYQLKDHEQNFPNELSKNQKILISPSRDFFIFFKRLVDNFDSSFKEAKVNGKIDSTIEKWKALINNMKVQYNFDLRRKILTNKIKPIDVIENNDKFLMSDKAKFQEQRALRNVLAQSDANLEKIAVLQYNDSNSQQEYQNNELPEQLQNLRSTYSNENLQKKMNREREKLEEFKEAISEESIIRLKKRIEEDLKGTSSYQRIMNDFQLKFGK